MEFDFDQWATLAKTSPEEFENQRRKLVEARIIDLLATGYDVQRLKGLQNRIDLERRRSHSPLKSCLAISSLMWDSFVLYRDQLNGFVYGGKSTAKSHEPGPGASVIPFRARTRAQDQIIGAN